METLIKQWLDQLKQLEADIRASGPVAPANCWIDPYTSHEKPYARLRSDSPIFNSKKQMGLGRQNSAEHKDWKIRIERRNSLQEIERRATQLQLWLESPLDFIPEIRPTLEVVTATPPQHSAA